MYKFAEAVASRGIKVTLVDVEDKKISVDSFNQILPTYNGSLVFCQFPSRQKLIGLLEDFLLEGTAFWKFASLEVFARSSTSDKDNWALHHLTHLLKKLVMNFDIIHIPLWRSPMSLALNIVRYQTKQKYRAKLICHLIYHPLKIEYALPTHNINKALELVWHALGRDALIRTLRNFDAITVSTPYEYKLVKQLGIDKVYFTGEGIDLDYVKKIKSSALETARELRRSWEGEHVILYLGSKVTGKGYPHVIQAFNELVNTWSSDIRLVVIGRESRSYKDKLMEKALVIEKRLEKGKKLYNYSFVSEFQKYAIIAASDLLVLPSKFETVPIAFLEAWAFKKPTIGCKIPTLGSVVEPDAAVLIDYGDVNQIKNAVINLLSDDRLSTKVGDSGYNKLIQTYNLNSVGKRLVEVYTKV